MEAARFNLVATIYVALGIVVALVAGKPLQLAMLASTIIALFLPVSLFPLLIIMNNRDYLGDQVNGRFTNIATCVVILLGFVVAAVSVPLLLITGGGG